MLICMVKLTFCIKARVFCTESEKKCFYANEMLMCILKLTFSIIAFRIRLIILIILSTLKIFV